MIWRTPDDKIEKKTKISNNEAKETATEKLTMQAHQHGNEFPRVSPPRPTTDDHHEHQSEQSQCGQHEANLREVSSTPPSNAKRFPIMPTYRSRWEGRTYVRWHQPSIGFIVQCQRIWMDLVRFRNESGFTSSIQSVVNHLSIREFIFRGEGT